MRKRYKIGKPGEIEVGDTIAHKVNPFEGYNHIDGLNTNHAGGIWTSRVTEIKDGVAMLAWGGSKPVEVLVKFEGETRS